MVGDDWMANISGRVGSSRIIAVGKRAQQRGGAIGPYCMAGRGPHVAAQSADGHGGSRVLHADGSGPHGSQTDQVSAIAAVYGCRQCHRSRPSVEVDGGIICADARAGE